MCLSNQLLRSALTIAFSKRPLAEGQLSPIGPQQSLYFPPNPAFQRALAKHRPAQHRSVVQLLERPGESFGIARKKLVRRDSFVQQPPRLRTQRAKLRQRDRVKLRIDQIHLQIRQPVRHRLRRRRKTQNSPRKSRPAPPAARRISPAPRRTAAAPCPVPSGKSPATARVSSQTAGSASPEQPRLRGPHPRA